MLLKAIHSLNEKFTIKPIVDFVTGKETKNVKDFGLDKNEFFGFGKDYEDSHFWNSLIRQCILHNILRKDIETYGLIKITEKGEEFLKNPSSFEILMNHNFDEETAESNASFRSKPLALDGLLLKILHDLRLKIAKKHEIPPYVVFQDPSLDDMATQYPTTLEEMSNISGVSQGKAKKFGKEFVEVIAKYVEENDIDKPSDFTVKTVADKSMNKVTIIQSVDRKIHLEEIAKTLKISFEDLLDEIEAIVESGTKLDLSYYLDEELEDYIQEEIEDYLMDSDTDDIEEAFHDLKEEDITIEEIRLIRIKILSDLGI